MSTAQCVRCGYRSEQPSERQHDCVTHLVDVIEKLRHGVSALRGEVHRVAKPMHALWSAAMEQIREEDMYDSLPPFGFASFRG